MASLVPTNAMTAEGMAAITKALEELQAEKRKRTPQDIARDKILETLDALGGTIVTEDAVIYQGSKFVLPEMLEGNIQGAIDFLEQLRQAEDEKYAFNKQYTYRPWDGAAAFARAFQRVFGTTGVGKATYTFFGRTPPAYISIPVSYDTEMQVPWGKVAFKPMDAVFTLGAGYDNPEDGLIFQITVEAPRKHRRRIEGFLQVVSDELEKRSIYRGKAINADENPGFLDPNAVDPSRVVYAQEAFTQLQANIWTVIQHAQTLRDKKIPLKRAVLLEGPYGSGKTMAGGLTSLIAVQNEWTFILVRQEDDPYRALKTAQIYAPAVVWFEDLDVISAGKTREEITRLLDALDGVQTKGAEVLAGFTTNFVHTIDKGVMRPGRIDAVIHIGKLDADGYERLIKVTLPADDLGDIDYGKVAEAFRDFLPAFAVEAAQRAIRYAVGRSDGAKIETGDLVDAANGLRPQLELVEGAGEARHGKPTIDGIVVSHVEDVINRAEVMGDPVRVRPAKSRK